MTRLSILFLWSLTQLVYAIDDEWQGLADVRLIHSSSPHSWLNEGLDKQRFDQNDNPLQLGQAILSYKINISDTVLAHTWLNVYTDRDEVIDLGEAFFKWRPIPQSAWRWQTRMGMFFPEMSLENNGLGWTSDYLISSSAINTWIGEEFRTLGAEINVHYDGARVASPHDWHLGVASFRWNDPATGLLTWRGWSVGDRITGSRERIPFPKLAIFNSNGYWRGQIQGIEPFKEIDHRSGYYATVAYQYLDRLIIQLMDYDNKGDPKGFAEGQWAWDTRFKHIALTLKQSTHTLLAQYMTGQTIMGYVPFRDLIADFSSWYLLYSHQFTLGKLHLRYEQFNITDLDHKPADPNQEDGKALAIAWQQPLSSQLDVTGEWLQQRSTRASRSLLVLNNTQQEDLWQLRLRWWF